MAPGTSRHVTLAGTALALTALTALTATACSSGPQGASGATPAVADALTHHLEQALDALPAPGDPGVESFVLTEHTDCIPVDTMFYCPLVAWYDDDPGNPIASPPVSEPEDPDLPKGDMSPQEWTDHLESLSGPEQLELLRTDLEGAIEAAPKAVTAS